MALHFKKKQNYFYVIFRGVTGYACATDSRAKSSIDLIYDPISLGSSSASLLGNNSLEDTGGSRSDEESLTTEYDSFNYDFLLVAGAGYSNDDNFSKGFKNSQGHE